MYELKTKETENSVIQFIESVDHLQKKEDAYKLLDIFTESTEYPAKMWGTSIIGFGKYNYKYASGHSGEFLIVGYSPRKSKISLYLATDIVQDSELMTALGKYTTGKSCVYINKLSDINLDILRRLIKQSLFHIKSTYPDTAK
ncbi:MULTISPECIES: DUF1801 domain-containing protein [Oceanobacillus]|uniref:YdhG-like domain-containing protein n=1 Tax=Oceanobacillus kimchii TaxID=746691 RepID=A0ABQ5TE93_9BACI|nr:MULTISPECIES: DUF1801 domain-containing protein [Oceanobacillus]MBT2600632.1 DUF1801 domain-containing protein [Oceanobacillus sp. ISL-74]MBT2650971.1 DUF1801 domain-containing protein [Oceanobacillus sp. ISL-73]MCT1578963.1 DUF1801 domain-containing protein [Oceanobacillus kimchii]MCT2137888.1 DUF1801 domain-containing protein [Oceanobacillus kimchii]OEH53430.1 hypothetical protein AQ616_17180 [Oceanobacillus sp. E9]